MAAKPRSHSPTLGRSILTTSAPMSPRNWVPNGPSIIWVKSTIRTPSRACRIQAYPLTAPCVSPATK